MADKHWDDLRGAGMLLYSESDRHVVELSFEYREEAERIFNLLDDLAASAGEAGTAETTKIGSAEGEHAVPKGDAQ
jgi:hypothetical protein